MNRVMELQEGNEYPPELMEDDAQSLRTIYRLVLSVVLNIRGQRFTAGGCEGRPPWGGLLQRHVPCCCARLCLRIALRSAV